MKYGELVELYDKLEHTTKRLEKTYYLSELLKKTPESDLEIVMRLLKGTIFPKWDQRKIGVASRLVIKALNIATGISLDKIEKLWKKKGDLGDVAEEICQNKSQKTLFKTDLTIKKVFDNLRSLAEMEGKGSVDRKLQLIAELLTSATPMEAKYVTRTVIEDLRVGVGNGSIRDAIVWAYLYKIDYNIEEKSIEPENREKYNEMVDLVDNAYDLTSDFSQVVVVAKKKGVKGLQNVSLKVGNPLNVMLFKKADDIKDSFERCGKPAAFEYKFDGFRMQIHRDGDKIILYTRRLEDVTKQFPDVVEILKKHIKSKNYILDAEIIGIDVKTKKWLPFQNISQRIKRKHGIESMAKNIPVMVNVFDAIQIDGENLIKEPFKKRRKLIEKIIKNVKHKLRAADQLVTDDVAKAEAFYKKSLSVGNEGIMVKNLEAPYKPGSRVGYGVKVKPTMETLDLVIVGAEWGEGKRSNWLSSFTVACIDGDGELKEIGKVGTGIKEKGEEGVTFQQLTNMLKPLIISEKGKTVEVKPKIVIEINYEEIQKSPTYSSGYALRFPRLVTIREDRSADEISTLKMVEEFYHGQKN